MIIIADCPLQLHQTPEPLVEEYSIAAQVLIVLLVPVARRLLKADGLARRV
jgi:hypothetical protein